jgi:hypothetical protein
MEIRRPIVSWGCNSFMVIKSYLRLSDKLVLAKKFALPSFSGPQIKP